MRISVLKGIGADPYHFMKEEKDRKWKINKNQE